MFFKCAQYPVVAMSVNLNSPIKCDRCSLNCYTRIQLYVKVPNIKPKKKKKNVTAYLLVFKGAICKNGKKKQF